MNALDARKQIQQILGTQEDGIFGPNTQAAYDLLSGMNDTDLWPAQSFNSTEHTVKATSFADPADVAAFRRCKDQGGTDQHCFSVGDNGVGKWGDSCVAGTGPACALPPEDWSQVPNPRKKLVTVKYGEKSVVCELRDTMPHKANIKNGAGIDLNPDACEALGISIPADARVSWAWV